MSLLPDLFPRLLPVLGTLFLGIFLRQLSVLSKEDAHLLLRLLFYIAAPAIVLLTVSKQELSIRHIHLPLISLAVWGTTLAVAWGCAKIFRLEKPTLAVFLLASITMNTSFILPFVLAGFGEEGFALAVLFDAGNTLMIFTFSYYLACRMGRDESRRASLGRVLTCPPLIALFIALVVNASGNGLPAGATAFLEPLAALFAPLTMLAMGALFTPRLLRPGALFVVIGTRMVLGLLLGLGFSALFGLSGLERVVACIGSAAPVGYTTVIYASLHDLDSEFAASAVSISMVLGVVMVPVLMVVG